MKTTDYQKNFLTILAILFLFITTACATPTTRRLEVDEVAAEIEAQKQRRIALEAWIDNKRRLDDVAYKIFTKAVSLCEEKNSFSIGITIANKYMFSEDMQEAALSLYDISNVLKIIHVMKGSAAEQAGIQNNDIPVAINDWPVHVGEKAGSEFLKKLKDASKDSSQISLKTIRDGIEQIVEITPDKICDYGIALSNEDIINAFADGKRVVITRGMMHFTEDDTELALVVSHELAHNVMKHIEAKTKNYMLGSILDIIAAVYGVNTQGAFGNIAAQAYSKEFEAEADYVGLYMMALAGLDIDNAPKFWRHMAVIHPGSIKTNFTATHPATPHRFVALEKTVQEVKQKIEAGLPLKPELKKNTSSRQPNGKGKR